MGRVRNDIVVLPPDHRRCADSSRVGGRIRGTGGIGVLVDWRRTIVGGIAALVDRRVANSQDGGESGGDADLASEFLDLLRSVGAVSPFGVSRSGDIQVRASATGDGSRAGNDVQGL
jgi:hypothetical protein